MKDSLMKTKLYFVMKSVVMLRCLRCAKGTLGLWFVFLSSKKFYITSRLSQNDVINFKMASKMAALTRGKLLRNAGFSQLLRQFCDAARRMDIGHFNNIILYG